MRRQSYYGILFVIVLAFFTANVQAQDSLQTAPEKWQNSWNIGLNGSQASYNNWSKGGVSSLSGTATSVYKAAYKSGAFSYFFENNMKYGQIKNDGQQMQKTDDQILIRNRFDYHLSHQAAIIGNINFQTQFAAGFDGTGDTRVKISDAFAPAYLQENVGIAFTPDDNFNAQAGLGLKQTIVTIDGLQSLYGVKADENLRFEAGINLGINFSKDIAENVSLTSSLESFSNLMRSLASTDFIFRNELTGKINKNLSTNFQFSVMYDDDFSKDLQIKQVLSVGFVLNLL